MNKVTVEHFTKICRFCMNQSNELKTISDVPSADIFRAITGIECTNILPQKMCLPCEHIFQTFLNFIEKSKDNIHRLTNLYDQAQQQIKFEYSDNEYDCSCINFDEEHIGKKENDETEREKNYALIAMNKVHEKYVGSGSTRKKVHFKCEKCKEKFPNEKILRTHIQTEKCVYVESPINCKKWSKDSKNCTLVPRLIMCKNCKLTFNTKSDLTVHCKGGFTCQQMDYKCVECNKFFKKQHRLDNHMRSHTKEAPFECTECEKTFRYQQNLRRHILIHKGIKKFKCDDCGKAFSRAHVLNEHRNIHTGHNPYICDYCGKGFKRYANHFIHVYRHKLLNGEVDQTEDKKLYLQLQCNICSKIFASRGGLENHLMLHQDKPREKMFLCTQCGKGFNTNVQLESHMRTHTGDRPFQCNQCSKKFKQKSAYSNHQLVHSGEKPYQCKQCERLFTQSGHLKVHMRVHSGEKPFICNFCGKKFALKSNLKVHTRTHTGEKPYVCSVCNKGYYDSTSLKKHKKSHGVGLPIPGPTESKIDSLEIVYCSNKNNDNKDILLNHTGS